MGVTFCNADNDISQIGVTRFGQPHTGQRIILVRIESGRNEDELRLELVCRRDERFEKDRMVVVVVPSGFHRYINGISLTGSLAPLGGPAGTRVVRKLVGAEKEDRRIVLETVLCGIAVMDIPVDDQHALQTVPFLYIPSCVCAVVKS